MAKKETKKVAKAIIAETKPVENPIEAVMPEPEPKPENPNITCDFCGYTIAKLSNEALIGVTCPMCKENGKLIN